MTFRRISVAISRNRSRRSLESIVNGNRSKVIRPLADAGLACKRSSRINIRLWIDFRIYSQPEWLVKQLRKKNFTQNGLQRIWTFCQHEYLVKRGSRNGHRG
jgi:hypothetical protein